MGVGFGSVVVPKPETRDRAVVAGRKIIVRRCGRHIEVRPSVGADNCLVCGNNFAVNRSIGGGGRSGPAGQRVIAGTAVNQVIARPTVDAVIVCVTKNGIVAVASGDVVVARSAVNLIIAKA